jgi:hypothetical protein
VIRDPRIRTSEEIDMVRPTSVDEYMAALPEDRRAVLEELRRTVKAAAPGATETIAYQMPALRSGDRFLVSYAAFKATTAPSRPAMQSSPPAERIWHPIWRARGRSAFRRTSHSRWRS